MWWTVCMKIPMMHTAMFINIMSITAKPSQTWPTLVFTLDIPLLYTRCHTSANLSLICFAIPVLRGGYSHTWVWWGSFAVMTPAFEILDLMGFICMPHNDLIGPLFLKKKSVCLYHIYLQRYFDLHLVELFIKMYYLTTFKHFVSIFPFLIDLRSFLSLIFTKP